MSRSPYVASIASAHACLARQANTSFSVWHDLATNAVVVFVEAACHSSVLISWHPESGPLGIVSPMLAFGPQALHDGEEEYTLITQKRPTRE